MKRTVSLFFLLIFIKSFAQKDTTEEYVNTSPLRYEDWNYTGNIKSVMLHEASFLLGPPVINFESGQQLELIFDDLDGDTKTYAYTLIHCDANWKPSDMVQAEYLGNFFEEQIYNYTFSSGTSQKYTHYQWAFPNNNMRISKTGNYLLKVYANGMKDRPAFTRRFMVYSKKVNITANIHQAANTDEYQNKQEIDFSVFYNGFTINNISTDLKVIVQQNSRWDNAIYNIQPLYLKPGELSYEYDDGTNTFDSGNEYRACSFKNFKFITQNTDRIYRDSALNWRVNLYPDEVKTFKRYYQTQDINGRYLITVEDRDSSLIDITAEYANIHFSFPYEFPMNEGDFYVIGNFNNNKFTPANRMKFNYFKKLYECDIQLKQGYYNYQYVFLPDGKPAAETNQIEGDHWETENDYTIYVYYRQPGTYYDQLIDVQVFNSVRK